MSDQAINPANGILYVDDEEKALKYFQMAFGGSHRVLTARSGAEGLEVLEREARGIGIVLSDQRMPGMTGAEFLSQVRRRHPRIIRILTTAYSDLESAVDAVNRGHIFQYVVKPWDLPQLTLLLQRAGEYFEVLAERDALVELKLNTLQRIICSDRVKTLLVYSRGLPEPDAAHFRRVLGWMVSHLPPERGGGAVSPRHLEIGTLLEGEYARMAQWLGAPALTVAEDDPDPVAGAVSRFAEVLAARGMVVESGPPEMRVLIPDPSSESVPGVTDGLFSLLAQKPELPLGTSFWELLIALSRAGRSLRLTVARGGDAVSLDLAPAAAPDEPTAIFRLLAEKFAAEDIARL